MIFQWIFWIFYADDCIIWENDRLYHFSHSYITLLLLHQVQFELLAQMVHILISERNGAASNVWLWSLSIAVGFRQVIFIQLRMISYSLFLVFLPLSYIVKSM